MSEDLRHHQQTDEQEVINFLLTTEIIPLCLRIMESGSELSKTVATFILQKILLDETGLNYICQVGRSNACVCQLSCTVFLLLCGVATSLNHSLVYSSIYFHRSNHIFSPISCLLGDLQTYERFSHVAMILGKMVIALAKEQSARLLKHVIRCYLRLSDNPR